MEIFPGFAVETDGTGRIHLGCSELSWSVTVVGADVKIGEGRRHSSLAEMGVEVQQFFFCVGIKISGRDKSCAEREYNMSCLIKPLQVS